MRRSLTTEALDRLTRIDHFRAVDADQTHTLRLTILKLHVNGVAIDHAYHRSPSLSALGSDRSRKYDDYEKNEGEVTHGSLAVSNVTVVPSGATIRRSVLPKHVLER